MLKGAGCSVICMLMGQVCFLLWFTFIFFVVYIMRVIAVLGNLFGVLEL
ncbi:unnamed protein product [Brassica oleracea]|uniref:Uncharacterized protein n=1 Tax=Brassica oleracea TaxID=3712 RepID=A0A3P6GHN9_BRAOL|nr:unnamed protein product [Brassica oleracea]